MVTDRNQNGDIVVNVDYSGDSLVLTDPEADDLEPGAFAGEARVEVDPLVEAFARSPYDPVIGAMMMGRATGEVVKRPPRRSWMRPIAYLLAIALIGQFLVLAYDAFVRNDPVFKAMSLSGLVFALAFAAGGALLLARLLRDSGDVLG